MNYNITPAHNILDELPIPLKKEIMESVCVNCKKEIYDGDTITYTRLHNGNIIWWHRRKTVYESNPCGITTSRWKVYYLKNRDRILKQKREYYRKRYHEQSIREQRPE